MRYSKFLVHSVLLFTIPSLSLYPQADISTIATQAYEDKIPQANPISYDAILNLLNDIEDLDEDELERRYSQEDLKRINQFLADLAKQGILPDNAQEDESLDDDIEALLSSEDDSYGYLFSLDHGSDYVFVPALPYNQGEVLLCKGWFKKQWKQTKKFIKKHKKAIIIGTAVVVATVIVVCAVATASAASAAAAGAAGAAAGAGKEDKDKSKTDETKPVEPSAASETNKEVTPVLNAAYGEPLLTEALEEHISTFKEIVVEDHLLQALDNSKNNSSYLGEQTRNLGAVLAHEALEGISELASFIPQLEEEIKELGARILPESLLLSYDDFKITPMENYEKLIGTGHEKIDQAFSTDQAERYTAEVKAGRDKFVTGLLPPPGGFPGESDISKVRGIIKNGQETALLAEELGLTNSEIIQLKKSEILETTVASTFENIANDKMLFESSKKFNEATFSLKKHQGKYLTEIEVREAIHQAGIPTFPRPEGIPEAYRIKLTDKSGGMKYVHPENEGTYVRIMPGKPHSPYPAQREPYVNHRVNGQSLDKFGNIVLNDSPEAHIPIHEFVYRE